MSNHYNEIGLEQLVFDKVNELLSFRCFMDSDETWDEATRRAEKEWNMQTGF